MQSAAHSLLGVVPRTTSIVQKKCHEHTCYRAKHEEASRCFCPNERVAVSSDDPEQNAARGWGDDSQQARLAHLHQRGFRNDLDLWSSRQKKAKTLRLATWSALTQQDARSISTCAFSSTTHAALVVWPLLATHDPSLGLAELPPNLSDDLLRCDAHRLHTQPGEVED